MPRSSVHGIVQARILEWVAMPSSRGSSQPGIEARSLALQADSLPCEPPGKPLPLREDATERLNSENQEGGSHQTLDLPAP